MYRPAAAWCENAVKFLAAGTKRLTKKGDFFMKLSFIPLLLTGKTISTEVRQALREKRLKDAAALLMQQYGLSCIEAGDLLDIAMCD
jgi:FAD synthase